MSASLEIATIGGRTSRFVDTGDRASDRVLVLLHALVVGMFLRVDDFDTAYQRMVAAGVRFVSSPRDEPYGRLAVFVDLFMNRLVKSARWS